jgi:hypothetical protein
MKQNFKQLKFVLIGIAASVLLIFSACCHKKDCCQGYTGTITDSSANALKNVEHFILKDSIVSWTARYQANKALICNDSLPGVADVLGDSCSFNSCIIKAIICNDSCIGLRVIYGMDVMKKVHILLVGIKPDYSTLYISRPSECIISRSMARTAMPAGDEKGGGEYAQYP